MIEAAASLTEPAAAGASRPSGGATGGNAPPHPGACLNCSTPLVGDYCHGCGQQGHVHRSLSAFGHDIAHGVLHFEGKIWRTLPLLLWRPGELTRRYIEGERVRFLSPVAIFLCSVFLMFMVFNAIGAEAYRDRRPNAPPAASAKSGLAGELPVEMDLKDAPAPLRWFNEPYQKARKNPSLLIYKLQSNAYKFSWALIPLSVPFLWLLFLHKASYRRRFGAYDHLVFVTYSITAMTVGLTAFTFLKLAGLNGPAAMLPLLLVPVHMYRQLRGAYLLSRCSAAWRAILLAIFACIAATLFFVLLIALGVMG